MKATATRFKNCPFLSVSALSGAAVIVPGPGFPVPPTCTFDILYLYSSKIILTYHGHEITATGGDTILIQPDLPYVISIDSHEPADILLISHYGEASWTYFNLLARHRVLVLRHHTPEALHPLIEKISFYMKYSSQLNLVLAVNYLVGLFTELIYWDTRPGGIRPCLRPPPLAAFGIKES